MGPCGHIGGHEQGCHGWGNRGTMFLQGDQNPRLRGTTHMLYRLFCLLVAVSSVAVAASPEEMPDLAKSRAGDLRLSAYVTIDGTLQLANSEAARTEAVAYLNGLGISKVYLETYRGASEADEATLIAARDFVLGQGWDVAAGIATYPGPGYGVTSDTGLPWFNYQAPETQEVVERVVRTSARVFDEIIIDDFLCSGDMSEISDRVRGNRTWSEYRRDLLTSLSQRIIIGPAREENPGVTVIIKYPQWYDLFHVYGYDVTRQPQLYDRVYVGTETRGATTQRYGFVQPYEGFINYRWLATLAGDKIGGAWFDHGDTDEHDFVDQAYQSVLAGASELILFSHNALRDGHPGHDLLREHFTHLADLAALVRQHPVEGVVGYKPPHSDAGTDMYILDKVGMFGVPLVPASRFPVDADALFLPTQAASDPEIVEKVQVWLEGGARRLVMTSGFLAATSDPDLISAAGLTAPVEIAPVRTREILTPDGVHTLNVDLGLAAPLRPGEAAVLLEASVSGSPLPYLISQQSGDDQIFVFNCESHSPEDFRAVNEYLLSPRDVGMMHLPDTWVNTLRAAFSGHWGEAFTAPVRVTFQPLKDNAAWVIQNYRNEPAQVRLDLKPLVGAEIATALTQTTGETVGFEDGVYTAEIPPRVHVVLQLNLP